MASLRVSLSLLLFLGAVYQAQALQCYACNDCESGYEDSLMTCQIPEMPTTVSTSTSTESTSASTSTSTESTSASTSTSTESTSPSESTSTERTSPSESTSTESTSPSESTSTESTSPSESTSTESTSPSESTSTESTIASTESTISSTESTIASTESTISSTESTIASTESTISSTESTIASTESTISSTESTISSSESTSPSTSTSENVNPEVQMRFRRYVKQVRADTIQPRCVVTSYEENGQKKTNRGCTIGVEGMTDEVRCRLVAGGFTGDLSRCHVCNEDKCNSATKSAIAFVPFLIGIISYLLN